MSDVLSHVSVEDLQELTGGIPCQGQTHSQGKFGHVPDQQASWLLVCPVCGPRSMQCDGRAHFLRRRAGDIRCNGCNNVSPYYKWRFVQL